jgi:MerR family copper efflux transcriptional regulator
MRIGEVARLAEVRVVTVRFYEAQGLLPRAAREASGYRSFPASAVQRIRFIRRAAELGFSLLEIRAFLAASDAPRLPERARRAAQVKIDEIDERIADLRRVQRAIRRVLRTNGSPEACPILASLGGPPSP